MGGGFQQTHQWATLHTASSGQLRGSEALVTPGVSPLRNTNGHAFAHEGPAGKPQV